MKVWIGVKSRNLKKFMDVRNGSTIGFLSTWVALKRFTKIGSREWLYALERS